MKNLVLLVAAALVGVQPLCAKGQKQIGLSSLTVETVKRTAVNVEAPAPARVAVVNVEKGLGNIIDHIVRPRPPRPQHPGNYPPPPPPGYYPPPGNYPPPPPPGYYPPPGHHYPPPPPPGYYPPPGHHYPPPPPPPGHWGPRPPMPPPPPPGHWGPRPPHWR